jgi:hypothetical protein
MIQWISETTEYFGFGGGFLVGILFSLTMSILGGSK